MRRRALHLATKVAHFSNEIDAAQALRRGDATFVLSSFEKVAHVQASRVSPLRSHPVRRAHERPLRRMSSSSPSSESAGEGVSSATSGGPIHPKASSSLCLDVVGQGTANGTEVQVWTCSGNANQQWTYDGSSLRVYGTKCLDVTGGSTTNGTKLQIWGLRRRQHEPDVGGERRDAAVEG